MSTDAADAFKPEWQCASHCHSTVNVPNRYAQRRVAVSTDASGTPRGEWQCAVHCHSVSNVPNRYVQRQVAVSTDASGTPRGEWQCVVHCHSTVNVRGGTPRGEWQCRPTQPARPGASGSVGRTLRGLGSAGRGDHWTRERYVGIGTYPKRDVPRSSAEDALSASGGSLCRQDGFSAD